MGYSSSKSIAESRDVDDRGRSYGDAESLAVMPTRSKGTAAARRARSAEPTRFRSARFRRLRRGFLLRGAGATAAIMPRCGLCKRA
jgi:hypothetical protein